MRTEQAHLRPHVVTLFLILAAPIPLLVVCSCLGRAEAAPHAEAAVHRAAAVALGGSDAQAAGSRGTAGPQKARTDHAPQEGRRDVSTGDDEAIAEWHFDEGSGDTAFDSVDEHDGTLINASWDSQGYANGCVALDGADPGVTVPHDPELGGLETLDLSFYLWLASVETGEEEIIVMKGAYGEDYLKISFWNNDVEPSYMRRRVQFALKRGLRVCSTRTSGHQLEADRWYHIEATYDGVAVRLYVDSALSGEWVCFGRMPLSTLDPLIFGRGFSGKLDEVQLNREPSAVLSTYLPAIASGCPPLPAGDAARP